MVYRERCCLSSKETKEKEAILRHYNTASLGEGLRLQAGVDGFHKIYSSTIVAFLQAGRAVSRSARTPFCDDFFGYLVDCFVVSIYNNIANIVAGVSVC
jgi:hypothetical protein